MTASISEVGLALVMMPVAVIFCGFVIGVLWLQLKMTIKSCRERDIVLMCMVLMGWSLMIGIALMFVGELI